MDSGYLARLEPGRFPSPCFVVDEERLAANAALLDSIQQRTGAKVLLALKGFAMWSLFPSLSRAHSGPLHGTCASSPHEARLGRQCFGGEVHAFAAGYSEADMADILDCANHVVFNSFSQWQRFKGMAQATPRAISCGMRINPEHSEGACAIYDPCSPQSRLGVRLKDFRPDLLEGISGLHFHTLCEQNSDALENTLKAVEAKFGKWMHGMDWINFGGGHHITRPDYDIDRLCRCIEHVQSTYKVQVYLEPGEAVALNAGLLLCTVLDVIPGNAQNAQIAILDTSAAAHMPDVLEMPYRPDIIGAGLPGEKKYSYQLAGKSCLAGDVIGEYSFDAPLEVGSRLAFLDMAHYSMVKTTTFNGLQLPAIATWNPRSGRRSVVRQFGYDDFMGRLS